MPPIRKTTGIRAATASSSQPSDASLAPKHKNPKKCELCNIVISRATDMPRHMKAHTKTKQVNLKLFVSVEPAAHYTLLTGTLPAPGKDVTTAFPRRPTWTHMHHGYVPKSRAARTIPTDPSLHQYKTKRRMTPVECEICKKVLSSKYCLPRHMKIHSKTRDFVCTWEGCDSSFFRNDHLDAHVRQAHSIPCPEKDCNYTTGHKGDLISHRTKRHGYVPSVSEPPCVAPVKLKEPERQPDDIIEMLEVEDGTESVDMNDDETTDDNALSNNMSIDEATDDDALVSDELSIDEVTSDVTEDVLPNSPC
ncbi:hypothetical protein FA15DRAFT_653473 [Coprinopsis marcescibilis]|uniref:C2H2-type domain-containing protein n=1 Tax=Coprinopsis marcescibilis TaxID=230819 RepID=A0A5C3L4U2_COPMA|nr:hypothetical protein FA15DRAFT_653473 [Coprinopsis marcescibilis]